MMIYLETTFIRLFKFCGILILAFFVMLPGAQKTYAQELMVSKELFQISQHLIQELNLSLSQHMTCKVSVDGKTLFDPLYNSDSEALLQIASRSRIYIFLHGFHPKPGGQAPKTTHVESLWRPHIEVLEELGHDFAACMFRIDTANGFGDHFPAVGDLLFALRWLTDDPELYKKDKQVSIVTFSAGFGYAKYGYLQLKNKYDDNELTAADLALTPTQFIFLAAPHHGSKISDIAVLGAAFLDGLNALDNGSGSSYEEIAQKRYRKISSAERLKLSTSRGAQQLSSKNPGLQVLDQLFQGALPPNVVVSSIFGNDDFVAPPEPSTLSYGKTYFFDGMGHGSFLGRITNAQYHKLLVELYSK